MVIKIKLLGEEQTSDCCCPTCGNEHSISMPEVKFEAVLYPGWVSILRKDTEFIAVLAGANEMESRDATELIHHIEDAIRKLKEIPDAAPSRLSTDHRDSLRDNTIQRLQTIRDACVRHPESRIVVELS